MSAREHYIEGDTLKDKNGQDFLIFGMPYTELIYVAPGTYLIGEKQEHQITFSQGYFIGKYPVTQELYEAVMGENPSHFKGKHRPVERVSWNDICEGNDSFLAKLNQKLKEKYGDIGMFSLSSEAQWEYAAAGGKQCDKPIMKYAGSNKLEDVGWFDKNSNNQTMPNGLKQPNALGLYDMSGNLWEWCQDYWANDVITLPKNGEPNPKKSDSHALRGGSYFDKRHYCRLRFRDYSQPDFRIISDGFRLCFSPVHPTN